MTTTIDNINVHHLNRYFEICCHYQQNPPDTDEVYCERHHIIFRSWINDETAGWDISMLSDECNLVTVPVRAHFILHKLMAKAYPCRRNKAALGMFAVYCHSKLDELSSRKVARVRVEARKAQSEALSGKNHPMFGKRGEDTPMFGKTHTLETKQNSYGRS